MKRFLLAFAMALIVYLALTAESGNIILWSLEEILLAIIFSIIAALIFYLIFKSLNIKLSMKWLNPVRWILFLVYLFGPFLFALIKANLKVAYAVITGKTRTAIVEIDPMLKNDFAIAMLADSITLTPGTLTLEVKDDKLYVHCLNAKSAKPKINEVCSSFATWIRRIAE